MEYDIGSNIDLRHCPMFNLDANDGEIENGSMVVVAHTVSVWNSQRASIPNLNILWVGVL